MRPTKFDCAALLVVCETFFICLILEWQKQEYVRQYGSKVSFRACVWSCILFPILKACPLGARCWCRSDGLAVQEDGTSLVELYAGNYLVVVWARCVRVDFNTMDYGVPDQVRFGVDYFLRFFVENSITIDRVHVPVEFPRGWCVLKCGNGFNKCCENYP